jgi:lysozyme
MTALEILVALIKEFEGCKLTAYRCPAGVWTIGYGATGANIKEGTVWTQKQADEALMETALNCLHTAIRLSPVLREQSMSKQAAIADFIYNLGAGNYLKSSLKFRVDQKNWVNAVHEIKKWDKVKGVPLKGLTKRRAREAELLLA